MLGGYKVSIMSEYSGISLLILMSCAVNDVSGYIQMRGSHTEAGIKWDDWALHWILLSCTLSKFLSIFLQTPHPCKMNYISKSTTYPSKLKSFQEVKQCYYGVIVTLLNLTSEIPLNTFSRLRSSLTSYHTGAFWTSRLMCWFTALSSSSPSLKSRWNTSSDGTAGYNSNVSKINHGPET